MSVSTLLARLRKPFAAAVKWLDDGNNDDADINMRHLTAMTLLINHSQIMPLINLLEATRKHDEAAEALLSLLQSEKEFLPSDSRDIIIGRIEKNLTHLKDADAQRIRGRLTALFEEPAPATISKIKQPLSSALLPS